VESPGAYLHARRASSSDLLSIGATGAAAALLLTSSGDLVLVVTLLGLATLDLFSTGLVAGAAIATLLRWGATSLTAIAGAQAVLGPGVAVAPVVGMISIAAAAVAIVVAGKPGVTAIPFGLLAALVAAFPAATTPARAGVRGGAALLGVLLSLLVTSRVNADRRRRIGAVAVVIALITAAVA